MTALEQGAQDLMTWKVNNKNNLVFVLLPSIVEKVVTVLAQKTTLKITTEAGNIYTGDQFSFLLASHALQNQYVQKNQLQFFLTKTEHSLIFNKSLGFVDMHDGTLFQTTNFKTWSKLTAKLQYKTCLPIIHKKTLFVNQEYESDEIFSREFVDRG